MIESGKHSRHVVTLCAHGRTVDSPHAHKHKYRRPAQQLLLHGIAPLAAGFSPSFTSTSPSLPPIQEAEIAQAAASRVYTAWSPTRPPGGFHGSLLRRKLQTMWV